MKFNPNEDFSKNISKLLALLQKMMKSQKIDNKELNNFFGKKNINLNLCFFTFVPYSLEEFMDSDELDEEHAFDNASHEFAYDLKFELNNDDLEFLKKNGIQF